MEQYASPHLGGEEIEDIIGKPPPWLLRWGLVVMLGLLVAFGAATHFIYYPDQVRLPATVAAPGAAQAVTVRAASTLGQLLVQEEQPVSKGQAVAYVGSPDEVAATLALEAWLKHQDARAPIASLPLGSKDMELGELQPAYDALCREMGLGAGNPSLQGRQGHARETLLSGIGRWRLSHQLVAPVAGAVRLVGFPQPGQLLAAGQPLLYVEKPGQPPVAEVNLPADLATKVKPGQAVQLSLERYPTAEFGYLEGRVEQLSTMPNVNKTYALRITLPHGMTTNTNRRLPLHGSLNGEARFITGNKRISERLWNTWRSSFSQ